MNTKTLGILAVGLLVLVVLRRPAAPVASTPAPSKPVGSTGSAAGDWAAAGAAITTGLAGLITAFKS